MFCSNCGAQNADNVPFCVNCGARIEAPVADAAPVYQAPVPPEPVYVPPAYIDSTTYTTEKKKSKKTVSAGWSLALGIIGFLNFCMASYGTAGICGLAGVICGISAVKKAKEDGGKMGTALAAIIVGSIVAFLGFVGTSV